LYQLIFVVLNKYEKYSNKKLKKKKIFLKIPKIGCFHSRLKRALIKHQIFEWQRNVERKESEEKSLSQLLNEVSLNITPKNIIPKSSAKNSDIII